MLDVAATVLFAGFVLLLFLGFLGIPPRALFSNIAAVPLIAALAILCWANITLTRLAPPTEPSTGPAA